MTACCHEETFRVEYLSEAGKVLSTHFTCVYCGEIVHEFK